MEVSEAADWDLAGTFDFHGQEVRYGVMGTGEPLVLLHGTPFSSVVWRRIAPHLATHRRVFYFDLLGYGRSHQQHGQDVSLGMQNQLFAALLDHWELDHPDVVAHDFGGTTALRTHLLDRRDYRTLTLIDPVALSPHGSALVQTARRHPDAFIELPGYIHEAILRSYIAGAVHRTLSEQEMSRYLQPWPGEVGQPAFYRQIAQMDDRHTDEIQDRYTEIRCPVTILWGEHDTWVPIERDAASPTGLQARPSRPCPRPVTCSPKTAPKPSSPRFSTSSTNRTPSQRLRRLSSPTAWVRPGRDAQGRKLGTRAGVP